MEDHVVLIIGFKTESDLIELTTGTSTWKIS
mgnify:CR=1 FL=1